MSPLGVIRGETGPLNPQILTPTHSFIWQQQEPNRHGLGLTKVHGVRIALDEATGGSVWQPLRDP
jgi:hypothetical protein